MYLYHLNIGSNLGHSISLIENAVARLASVGTVAARSDFHHSKPWGFKSEHNFVNLGVNLQTDLQPTELLAEAQRIEKELTSTPHRNADGSYADRQLDIDIIACDNLTIHTENLTIPHPQMHLRPFVLEPMAQILPDWIHPDLMISLPILLDLCNKNSNCNVK